MTKKLTKPNLNELEELTPKQAAFFYCYAESGNGTRSALRAYYPDFPVDKAYSELTEKELIQYHGANHIARKNLQKVSNSSSLFLDHRGMDFKRALDKLDAGLEATKASNAAILLTKDGKTMKAEEQGLIEVPDHQIRLAYWDRLMRLLGRDVSDGSRATGIEISDKDKTVRVIVDVPRPQR